MLIRSLRRVWDLMGVYFRNQPAYGLLKTAKCSKFRESRGLRFSVLMRVGLGDYRLQARFGKNTSTRSRPWRNDGDRLSAPVKIGTQGLCDEV